jgi:hypothetical protein
MGLEPATYGLQNRCSAIELHRQRAQSRFGILPVRFKQCQIGLAGLRQCEFNLLNVQLST